MIVSAAVLEKIKIFVGFWPSKDPRKGDYKALSPCVKLVCGRRVISLVDRGLGFSRYFEGGNLMATEVDSIAAFEYSTEEQAESVEVLWAPYNPLVRLDDESTPKNIGEAMKWLVRGFGQQSF